MKNYLKIIVFMIVSKSVAQEFQKEKYQILPFGSIKPSGWIKEQMQKDT